MVKNLSENEVLCEGKESCKVYLKSFLAAIPIRELQADMKKGLLSSTPLHHRLQIEFHYTQLQPPVTAPAVDDSANPIPIPKLMVIGVSEQFAMVMIVLGNHVMHVGSQKTLTFGQHFFLVFQNVWSYSNFQVEANWFLRGFRSASVMIVLGYHVIHFMSLL
ncbi:hypothetical protein L1987_75654 [Smallanthus sonchifolius]|uniref:Uncharacterized protein n=1 Tax=Smallanthus sonchifolius TaxID=185202 RepID=A0ACB9A6E0_9ASTR|nr:hypothetical protein L1987_75654 [Smallanthus sonchifolius]